MAITQEIFAAYLQCPTKCHLVAYGVECESAPYLPHVPPADYAFRRDCLGRICAGLPVHEVYFGSPSLKELKEKRYRVVADCNLATADLAAHIDCLQLPATGKRLAGGEYMPVRFVSTETVSTMDRTLLAFDAVVLTQVIEAAPIIGEIIRGVGYRTARIQLTDLCERVHPILQKVAQCLANPTPPPPVLNKHCGECRFAQRCWSIAKEMDDLSLLSKMSEKERLRYHDRGIFTVTQLSHTFRHRRRAGKKHDYALKALALRKNRIHVIGNVKWTVAGTPVYIDVKGEPDRRFYYCVGIRFESAGRTEQHSLWAAIQPRIITGT